MRRLTLFCTSVGFVMMGCWLGFRPVPPRSTERRPTQETAAIQAKRSPASEKRNRDVQAQVERLNQKESRQVQRLIQAGWSEVQSNPPDSRLLDLDPDLLPEREAEVQLQLQTSFLSDEVLDRVERILKETEQEKTRFLAIEALGRLEGVAAQQSLIRSFHWVSMQERSHVLAQLRPRELDGPVTDFLIQILSERVDEDLKWQALGILAVMALAGQNSEGVLRGLQEKMSNGWELRLAETFDHIRAGRRL